MSTPSSEKPIFKLSGLKQVLTDKDRDQTFTVFVDHTLEFRPRDFIGLLGPSGCGKTTLLSVLGLLRKPSNISTFEISVPDFNPNKEGRVAIDIKDCWDKKDVGLIERVRRRYIGFSLQSGELVNSLTVAENIRVPLTLNNWSRLDSRNRVLELLQSFNLNRAIDDSRTSGLASDETSEQISQFALANSRVNLISGGEYQRVCLARAIAHHPSVVFVDEPTAALNRELAHNALSVMRDLQLESKSPGITFMITHDEELAERFCNIIVRMSPRKGEAAGEVTDVSRNTTT